MKTWLIYKHINKINGKVYIGLTSQNPTARWGKGSGYGPTQYKMYRAIQKYGWDNFDHEIIEDNIPSLKEAQEKERYWIKHYDSTNTGYNIDEGGCSGTGCKLSIYQFSSTGEFLKEWDSITEAALAVGTKKNNIGSCLKGKSKTAGGYVWFYNKDDALNFDFSTSTVRRPKVKTPKGQTWLNNGVEEFRVDKDQIQEYLDKGYSFGRLKFSDAAREHISEARKRDSYFIKNNPRDTIRIYKNNKEKCIYPEELEQYLADGWIKGRPPIKQETREKMSKTRAGRTLNKSWRKAMSKARKGKIWITDGVHNKYIPKEQLVNIESGWRKGRTIYKQG